jgi:hypothetical protein
MRKSKEIRLINQRIQDVAGPLKKRCLDLVAQLTLIDGRSKKAKAIRAEIVALEAEHAENQARIQALLDGLNRRPTELDRVAVHQLAGIEAEIAEDERQGRDPFAKRKLLLQLMRGLELKPAPAAPKAKPDSDWANYLASPAETVTP